MMYMFMHDLCGSLRLISWGWRVNYPTLICKVAKIQQGQATAADTECVKEHIESSLCTKATIPEQTTSSMDLSTVPMYCADGGVNSISDGGGGGGLSEDVTLQLGGKILSLAYRGSYKRLGKPCCRC